MKAVRTFLISSFASLVVFVVISCNNKRPIKKVKIRDVKIDSINSSETDSNALFSSQILLDTLFLEFMYNQSKEQFNVTAENLVKNDKITGSQNDYHFTFYLDKLVSPIYARINPQFIGDEKDTLKEIILDLHPNEMVSNKYLNENADYNYYFSSNIVKSFINIYKIKYGNPKVEYFTKEHDNFGIVLRRALRSDPNSLYKPKLEVSIIENVTKYTYKKNYHIVYIYLSKYTYQNQRNIYSDEVKQIRILYTSTIQIDKEQELIREEQKKKERIIEQRRIEAEQLKNNI